MRPASVGGCWYPFSFAGAFVFWFSGILIGEDFLWPQKGAGPGRYGTSDSGKSAAKITIPQIAKVNMAVITKRLAWPMEQPPSA